MAVRRRHHNQYPRIDPFRKRPPPKCKTDQQRIQWMAETMLLDGWPGANLAHEPSELRGYLLDKWGLDRLEYDDACKIWIKRARNLVQLVKGLADTEFERMHLIKVHMISERYDIPAGVAIRASKFVLDHQQKRATHLKEKGLVEGDEVDTEKRRVKTINMLAFPNETMAACLREAAAKPGSRLMAVLDPTLSANSPRPVTPEPQEEPEPLSRRSQDPKPQPLIQADDDDSPDLPIQVFGTPN